jgi:predicted phage terminase large subunit-like protein
MQSLSNASSPLPELLELRRRRTVRKSLTSWCRHIGFDPAPHHKLIIREIEALLTAEDYDTLLIFAPPGSAKSSYVSVALPSWYLASHPKNSVLAASHTTTLAEKWGRRVRNLVSEHARTLGIELAADSQAAGRWSLEQGGEYQAAGVGVGIAGFRADLGIIDDPIGSREQAFSELIREKLWDWFINDFSSRLKPSAKRVVMHTRWHEDDPAGRIMTAAKQGKYRIRVLSLPAIARADDPLGRKPGQWLWDDPTGYNYAAFLKARHREVPPFEWSALYQQEPTPDEGDYFKREWWNWYDVLPKHLRFYGSSDYAVTAKGGDFTVHAVAGVDPDDNLYVADIWRQQTTSNEWVEALLAMAAQYKPMCWAEEDGQIVKSVGPFISQRQRERKVYFRREQFTSIADKPTRSRSFQARAAMRKVYLPRSAPWLSDFLAELHSFPAGRTDDQVDTMGLIGRMLDEMIGGRIPPAVDTRNRNDYTSRESDEADAENNWKTV